ncbi:B-cadherin [Oryzias melastigma]|uniref:B-cadherin n=1 Tax=Oryzias melastigma TaxID=30732 RepID=A0A834F431_ORYME|nr:B-cadherin [Oryzias melastigma]
MRTVWCMIVGALIIAVQSQDGLRRRKRDWLIPPLNIPENSNGPFPQKIAQVRASHDKSKKVSYSISGPGADQDPLNIFAVDKDTGDLYVTQRLDREKQHSYSMLVKAVAEDGLATEDPIQIVINVIDMNDNKPAFTEDVFAGEVVESSPIGTEVIRVTATDLDEPGSDNSIIRYSIESQEPQESNSSMFTINPVTGVISVGALGLDSEKYPQYTLEVEAADMRGDGLTGRAKVVVNVTKSLESVPVIDQSSSQDGLRRRKREWLIPPLNIPENSNGPFPQKIAQVRASHDKSKKVSYSISGPGADQDPLNIFTVDKDTGDLYLTQRLDREKQHSYSMLVKAVAEDGLATEDPIQIVINVIDMNDNKPAFTEDVFAGEVVESSPIGTEVIQVTATDLDEPGSDNSIIRYSIESQEPQESNSSMFTINPVTGVISVGALGLDSEKYPQYTLEVEAADMRGDGLTGRAKVVVNVTKSLESVPVIDQSSVRASHDKSKKVSYSISGPGADQDPLNIFTVDKDTGDLYLTQRLDREKQHSYSMLVKAVAEDGLATEDPIQIVINVIDMNDNKPAFTEDLFAGEVVESSPIGTEVIQVTATDLDEPGSDNSIIRYSIESQEPQESNSSMFTINPVTGVISVGALGLDSEKYPQYTLEVEAADMRGDGLTGRAKVVVNVTKSLESVPVIDQSSPAERLRRRRRRFSLAPIGIVENNNGPFPLRIKQFRYLMNPDEKISYTIIGCGADPLNIFFVDKDTCDLYVTQPLDREECSHYTLRFETVNENGYVEDIDPPFTIKVFDENDNKPIFTEDVFTGEVPESSPIGFSVLQVHANDRDELYTPNSDIRYSIQSQNPQEPSPSMFTINSRTGVLTVNATGLNKAKYPQYILEVKAADMEGNGFSARAKVNITVMANNDHAPDFPRSFYMTAVKENAVGALVADIVVTDGDKPQTSAWNAKFKIVGGDPDGLFSVRTADDNKHRGIITTAKALEYERNRTHILLVTVENDIPFSTPMTTSTATVLVNVLDVNETPGQNTASNPGQTHELIRESVKRTGMVMVKKNKKNRTPLQMGSR